MSAVRAAAVAAMLVTLFLAVLATASASCPAGTYLSSSCRENAGAAGCPSCEACPEGAVCAGGSALPAAGAPGWESASGNHSTVLPCDPADACHGTNECAVGYTGALCDSCSAGYFNEGDDTCVKCPADPWLPLVIVVVGTVAVLAIGGCLALCKRNALRANRQRVLAWFRSSVAVLLVAALAALLAALPLLTSEVAGWLNVASSIVILAATPVSVMTMRAFRAAAAWPSTRRGCVLAGFWGLVALQLTMLLPVGHTFVCVLGGTDTVAIPLRVLLIVALLWVLVELAFAGSAPPRAGDEGDRYDVLSAQPVQVPLAHGSDVQLV